MESASLQVERFAPYIAGTILLSIYVIATFKSFYKALWYDEVLTTLVAKLPALSDISSFIQQAADGQPVFYYWIVRASIWLFGNDPWGLRAPSTIGYVIFCLSLYWFVGRQTSRIYGLLALLFPSVTGCWYYATEGRPYGLVMAGTGIAALSWQSLAMNRSRKLALAGFSLSLLFAFSVHYFATLLVVPFAVAELFRTISRRKLDMPAWVALALPFSIFAWYLPIMHETRKNVGVRTSLSEQPAWLRSWATFVGDFIGPALIAVICVALLYLLYAYFVQRNEPGPEYMVHPEYLLSYIALVLALACILPFASIAAGKYVTQQFFSRYAIGAMFGVTGAATLIMWFAFRQSRTAAIAVALVFGALISRTVVRDLIESAGLRVNPPKMTTQNLIPGTVGLDDQPIVIADVQPFLVFHYYGDPVLRRRLYYVSSEESALRILGVSTSERLMIKSASYFGTQVIDYSRWIKEHPVFYLYGIPDWIVPQLLEDGANLRLLRAGDNPLYRVTLADSGSAPELRSSEPSR